MIKIECDTHDLTTLVDRMSDMAREAAIERQAAENNLNRIYALQDEIARLKSEAGRIPAGYNAETEIRNLIAGLQVGNKISAIKAVRTLLGLGLKEAKDLVEQPNLPAKASSF